MNDNIIINIELIRDCYKSYVTFSAKNKQIELNVGFHVRRWVIVEVGLFYLSSPYLYKYLDNASNVSMSLLLTIILSN